MATGDIKIHKSPYSTIPTLEWQTEANTTAILAGEPVKLKVDGSPYAIPCADADLTVGTDSAFLGIAATASTHTASADGVVSVYLPLPGIIWKCAVTTAANFDTTTEINALVGDKVTFDLVSSTYTIDENDGNADASALFIVGGDATDTSKPIAYFTIRHDATFLSGGYTV